MIWTAHSGHILEPTKGWIAYQSTVGLPQESHVVVFSVVSMPVLYHTEGQLQMENGFIFCRKCLLLRDLGPSAPALLPKWQGPKPLLCLFRCPSLLLIGQVIYHLLQFRIPSHTELVLLSHIQKHLTEDIIILFFRPTHFQKTFPYFILHSMPPFPSRNQ